jgi:hypothetical protein
LQNDALSVAQAPHSARSRRSLRQNLSTCARSLRSVHVFGATVCQCCGQRLSVPGTDHLRKDYAHLFERFFYFLEDLGPGAFGVAVFDELEKIRSHLPVSRMDSYFKRTSRGRQRAGRILPEPLFVHSDLTTGVQLADLVAYLPSWGWRLRSMTRPDRPELAGFVAQICQLRHRAVREVAGNPLFTIWSLAFITDLRPQTERDVETAEGTRER